MQLLFCIGISCGLLHKEASKKNPDGYSKKPKWAQVILNFVERFCDKEKWVLWFKIVVACLPTIVIALPFDDFIEEHFNNYVVVAIALIVYGVLFIIVENYNKSREPQCTSLEDLSFKTAFLIGCFQVLSVIPGTSRSGSTIIGGILVGTSRTVAAEFTFFPWNPGYVRSQPSEDCEIRFWIYRYRGADPGDRYGGSVCSFYLGNQVPDGLYQET